MGVFKQQAQGGAVDASQFRETFQNVMKSGMKSVTPLAYDKIA